jgi:hypothetical protein
VPLKDDVLPLDELPEPLRTAVQPPLADSSPDREAMENPPSAAAESGTVISLPAGAPNRTRCASAEFVINNTSAMAAHGQ